MDRSSDDEHFTISRESVSDGTVVRVEFDRPEKLNALPKPSLTALCNTFETVGMDDGDVVEMSGRGEDFCIGADLEELDTVDPQELNESVMISQRLVESIRACPLPVVATVQGRAYGVGFILCLASDVVVASEEAEFSLPEVSLGIPVAGFVTAMLPDSVGETRARKWLFTGTTIPGSDSHRAGFVTDLASPGNLEAESRSVLEELSGSSAFAISLMKEGMDGPAAADGRDGLREFEIDSMRAAFEDGDTIERLRERRE